MRGTPSRPCCDDRRTDCGRPHKSRRASTPRRSARPRSQSRQRSKQTDDIPDTGQTILVSTAENRLYVRQGGQTVFQAVCSTGKLTIYLNTTASSATYVAWLVLG
jgi:hypothetical protein